MKRLIFIFSFILLLTACGTPEEIPAAPEEVEVVEEVTATEPTVEVETVIVDSDAPVQTVVSHGGEPVSFTTEVLEGLVEDTIGYTFEVPAFAVEGSEDIRAYYDELAAHLESYTKETVYTEAASRACIASVYGYVTDAVLDGDVLTVTYVYECDFSDTEESVENVRTDSFSATTGECLN